MFPAIWICLSTMHINVMNIENGFERSHAKSIGGPFSTKFRMRNKSSRQDLLIVSEEFLVLHVLCTCSEHLIDGMHTYVVEVFPSPVVIKCRHFNSYPYGSVHFEGTNSTTGTKHVLSFAAHQHAVHIHHYFIT